MDCYAYCVVLSLLILLLIQCWRKQSNDFSVHLIFIEWNAESLNNYSQAPKAWIIIFKPQTQTAWIETNPMDHINDAENPMSTFRKKFRKFFLLLRRNYKPRQYSESDQFICHIPISANSRWKKINFHTDHVFPAMESWQWN